MLGLADRLIGHNPYEDSLRAAALTLHRQIGGLKQATAYYEAYAALLRTELGTKPGESLAALFHSLATK